MTLTQAKAELEVLQKKLAAYRHAAAVISYDGTTVAPKGTAGNRAQTLSVLSAEMYRLSTGEDTVALLEYLDANREQLTPYEQRTVTLMLRDIRDMQCIPMEEYVAHQKLLVESDDIWHRAKATNDFALFEPVLTQIFANMSRFAGYCAPEKEVYDYWLNKFEEGASMATCDAFFSTLRAHIVPLLKAVQEKPQVSDACINGHFPVAQQEKFSELLMKVLSIDTDHCGLGTTEHPFTTTLGSLFDVRITTHYYEENPVFSMYSVIHEGGHALYELGIDPALAYTVLDDGVSMGIHESQSRFYENMIGRSRPFVEYLFPMVQEIFPQQMAGYTADDFYKAVNRAQPSLIRTEADELTYCLHIMVRYELEKAIFSGALSVHDLPQAWNRLYKEYLGIDVPDDTRGVLQDTHRNGGLIG